jgi:uncharacterized Zn finger protein (UPF0148 family)
MASPGPDLMGHPMDVPCPRCGYPVWVVLAEVAAGITVICPCCRTGIRLVDETGSVQVVNAQVQEALHDLAETLKGMFQ